MFSRKTILVEVKVTTEVHVVIVLKENQDYWTIVRNRTSPINFAGKMLQVIVEKEEKIRMK